MSGSCVVCCLVSAEVIWTAWCGDCAAVIGDLQPLLAGVIGSSNPAVPPSSALRVTQDHNLRRHQSEHQRIATAGGIITPDGRFTRPGAPGRLQVTRAFGDWWGKPCAGQCAAQQGISDGSSDSSGKPSTFPSLILVEPEVSVVQRKPTHRLLALGSDGVFEFMPCQRIVDIAMEGFAANPSGAVELSNAGMNIVSQVVSEPWNSDDNSTILLVDLGRVPKKASARPTVVLGAGMPLGILTPRQFVSGTSSPAMQPPLSFATGNRALSPGRQRSASPGPFVVAPPANVSTLMFMPVTHSHRSPSPTRAVSPMRVPPLIGMPGSALPLVPPPSPPTSPRQPHWATPSRSATVLGTALARHPSLDGQLPSTARSTVSTVASVSTPARGVSPNRTAPQPLPSSRRSSQGGAASSPALGLVRRERATPQGARTPATAKNGAPSRPSPQPSLRKVPPPLTNLRELVALGNRTNYYKGSLSSSSSLGIKRAATDRGPASAQKKPEEVISSRLRALAASLEEPSNGRAPSSMPGTPTSSVVMGWPRPSVEPASPSSPPQHPIVGLRESLTPRRSLTPPPTPPTAARPLRMKSNPNVSQQTPLRLGQAQKVDRNESQESSSFNVSSARGTAPQVPSPAVSSSAPALDTTPPMRPRPMPASPVSSDRALFDISIAQPHAATRSHSPMSSDRALFDISIALAGSGLIGPGTGATRSARSSYGGHAGILELASTPPPPPPGYMPLSELRNALGATPTQSNFTFSPIPRSPAGRSVPRAATKVEVLECPWCDEAGPWQLKASFSDDPSGILEQWRRHIASRHLPSLESYAVPAEVEPCPQCCRPCATAKGRALRGMRLPLLAMHHCARTGCSRRRDDDFAKNGESNGNGI